MFYRTLLDPHFLHCSSRPLLHLQLVRPPFLPCYILQCVHPLPLCTEACFGQFVEESTPKSLIEVSSEHTPIILHPRRGSFDTKLDDPATTVDASEVYDTTGVERLTSPRFAQEREASAVSSGVSCSQTHSCVEKSRRDVEPFWSFGKPLMANPSNQNASGVRQAIHVTEIVQLVRGQEAIHVSSANRSVVPPTIPPKTSERRVRRPIEVVHPGHRRESWSRNWWREPLATSHTHPLLVSLKPICRIDSSLRLLSELCDIS